MCSSEVGGIDMNEALKKEIDALEDEIVRYDLENLSQHQVLKLLKYKFMQDGTGLSQDGQKALNQSYKKFRAMLIDNSVEEIAAFEIKAYGVKILIALKDVAREKANYYENLGIITIIKQNDVGQRSLMAM
jgi:hypothetical protein